jgi:NADP-dependent 3-hydroxy acid dehydrogenase YdfG
MTVFATGRTLEKISDLKELGIECVVLSVDDPASVASCHEVMIEKLDGRGLDFLFNNAGVGKFLRILPISSSSDQSFQPCFAQPWRAILMSARPCLVPMCLAP